MRLRARSSRDLTEQFREAVKRVDDNAAAHSEFRPGSILGGGAPAKNKNRILPARRRRASSSSTSGDRRELSGGEGRSASGGASGSLESLARQIVAHISRLQQFLLDHRSDYVDVVRATWTTRGPALTDRQKDHIDAGANQFIHTCQSLIARFQTELKEAGDNLNAGRRDHLSGVVQILERYLKAVCQIYAQQRAIRVQRELEFQKLSRLEIKARKSSQSTGDSERHLESDLLDRLKASPDNEAESETEMTDEELLGCESGEVTPPKRRKSDARRLSSPPTIGVYDETLEDEPLSPEEIQLLERENTQLYEHFMQNQDSVQQIENKVVKIAELQEVFADKVLQQKDDIDLVHHHAVTTTENVKDANEELRKAIQNQASIRVYILFFLLVMSFSLLFLDWYNE